MLEERWLSYAKVETECVIDGRIQSSGVATRVVAAAFHGFCRDYTSDFYKYLDKYDHDIYMT